MDLVGLLTQPHSLAVDIILASCKYIGYLLGVGAIMNILGLGKVFDYLLKLFAEILGFIIGVVIRKGYRHVLKPLLYKLFTRKKSLLEDGSAFNLQ